MRLKVWLNNPRTQAPEIWNNTVVSRYDEFAESAGMCVTKMTKRKPSLGMETIRPTRMTSARGGVIRSDYLEKTVRKWGNRLNRRTSMEVRDKAERGSYHNTKRRTRSWKRNRRLIRNLLQKAGNIFASPWSIGTQRMESRGIKF